MKRLRIILVAAFVLTVFTVSTPTASAQTTYYVDVAVGDDGNLGTSEGAGNAWASIGKAMQTVAADDTTYVKASGDYVAQDGATGAIGQVITEGTSTTPITFEGYVSTPGDGTLGSVTLDAGTNSLTNCINQNTASSFNIFRNFKFIGASSDGVALADVDVQYHNCEFLNNGASGLNAGGNQVVSNCLSANNALDGQRLITGSAVSDSVFHSNGAMGLRIGRMSSIVRSLFYENANVQIIGSDKMSVLNCTFDGGGVAVGLRNFDYLGTVKNTTFYDCTIGVDADAGAEGSAISKNNIFFSNDTDRTNWPSDPSDIEADPLFVDAAGNDYRLQFASPARQAGIDAGEVVNGESFIDIGAQQAVGGTTVIVID